MKRLVFGSNADDRPTLLNYQSNSSMVNTQSSTHPNQTYTPFHHQALIEYESESSTSSRSNDFFPKNLPHGSDERWACM